MGPKLLVHWLSTREQTDPQTLELDVDRYVANIDNDGEPGTCCSSAVNQGSGSHSALLQLVCAAGCSTGTGAQPCRAAPPARQLARLWKLRLSQAVMVRLGVTYIQAFLMRLAERHAALPATGTGMRREPRADHADIADDGESTLLCQLHSDLRQVNLRLPVQHAMSQVAGSGTSYAGFEFFI